MLFPCTHDGELLNALVAAEDIRTILDLLEKEQAGFCGFPPVDNINLILFEEREIQIQ